MKCVVFVILALCFLCCNAVMNKVTLPNTDVTGAVCLDGSPGIYFFKEAASDANKTKWIFHFLGGGMCMSDEECLLRTQTLVGSSTVWPDEYSYGGPISEDPEYNPDFYDWNHVFFVYCDGASFSGNKTDPVEVGGKTIYYRGNRILVETINDLIANKGLDKGTDVLVVGDSAGGMATFYHIDQIKSLMPSSVTRFKGAPFSGVFLDRPNVIGDVFFRDTLGGVFNNQECSGSVNQKCIEAYKPANEEWRCFFAEYSLNYTDTPLFVINSADDMIGLFCVALGMPLHGISNGTGNCSAVPGWEDCELRFQCTPEQWSKILEYSDGFRETIYNNYKLNQDGNGLFEYSCYTHAIETGNAWEHLVVQDTVLRDAVSKWFFSDNEPAAQHTYKDCNNTVIPACNPTCKEPSPSGSGSGSGSTGSGASGSTGSGASGSTGSGASGSTGSGGSGTGSSGTGSGSTGSGSHTGSGSKTSTSTSTSKSSSCVVYPMMSIIFVALLALYHIVM